MAGQTSIGEYLEVANYFYIMSVQICIRLIGLGTSAAFFMVRLLVSHVSLVRSSKLISVFKQGPLDTLYSFKRVTERFTDINELLVGRARLSLSAIVRIWHFCGRVDEIHLVY
jgi:hypothetical protein